MSRKQSLEFMHDYNEPELSILVLDFAKPKESRLCLESIKQHVKFPVKVIYLHNGPAEYALDFYREGLIDQFIQSKVNNGLGVGTRDLVGNCFSQYFMMLQNDQIICRDFEYREFEMIVDTIGKSFQTKTVASVGLAGHVAGQNIYSERCHIMETAFYKEMERMIPLSAGGAGPYHHQIWREEQIQKHYREDNFIHAVSSYPLVTDNGVWTIRDVAGGRVKMRTDTKAVWWLKKPSETYIFPEMSEEEWIDAILGNWKDGTIPKAYLEKNQSFNCWGEQS